MWLAIIDLIVDFFKQKLFEQIDIICKMPIWHGYSRKPYLNGNLDHSIDPIDFHKRLLFREDGFLL